MLGVYVFTSNLYHTFYIESFHNMFSAYTLVEYKVHIKESYKNSDQLYSTVNLIQGLSGQEKNNQGIKYPAVFLLPKHHQQVRTGFNKNMRINKYIQILLVTRFAVLLQQVEVYINKWNNSAFIIIHVR